MGAVPVGDVPKKMPEITGSAYGNVVSRDRSSDEDGSAVHLQLEPCVQHMQVLPHRFQVQLLSGTWHSERMPMVVCSALRRGLAGWGSFTALSRAAARQWTCATPWGGRFPYSATTSANVDPVEESESPKSGDVWDERQKVLKTTAKPATPATVMLFPGQGTQHVGMGQAACELPVVKEMFETASGVLGYDLLALCRDGPISKLNLTRYSQPAIFVCSLAAVEKLNAESPEAISTCAAAAGYSVGEYAALVFSGALSFKSAVHLVKIRASLMQTACEIAPSGMLTMRVKAGADLEAAMEAARIWAQKHGVAEPVCQVASSLYSQCKVIGGHDKALRFLADNGGDFGLIPVKRVEVSGAFHTPLMDSASKGLRRALQMVKFSKPSVKVYSNVLARPYMSALEIPDSLAVQVSKEVKWEQILHAIYDRPKDEEVFPVTYETGPGDHLGKMLKRVNAKAFSSYRLVEP
uniref:PKS_AT domain-containing protein n=1 Tax=Trichuris muris TaxID=70415 RepID=A0A5S6QR73_TRIMR